jgi:hypothetical protein
MIGRLFLIRSLDYITCDNTFVITDVNATISLSVEILIIHSRYNLCEICDGRSYIIQTFTVTIRAVIIQVARRRNFSCAFSLFLIISNIKYKIRRQINKNF